MTDRERSTNPSRPQATPLQRFGAALRQYRQQRGLSQKALAARTGIGHSYISQIELGKRNIALLALLRLAHALEIPAASLLVQLDPNNTHCKPIVSGQQTQSTAVMHATPPSVQPGDAPTLLALLGATLRQYRQHRNLSQRALATSTGLRYSYICDIEQGRRNLSILNLIRIAQALGLSVAFVLAPLETSQHPTSDGEE